MERLSAERARVYWMTGLSGAGKSTLALGAVDRLEAMGLTVALLDGDVVRKGLCRDLGYCLADRKENNRRCAEVAKILAVTAQRITICSFISPTRKLRQEVREIVGQELFREVYIRCRLETCIKRDPKGNYQRALAGEIPGYTGIESPYEEPEAAHCIIDTEAEEVEDCIARLVRYILSSSDRKLTSDVLGLS